MRHMPEHSFFSRHPVLRTSDLDEARHKVSQIFCDHRLNLGRHNAPLRVSHNAVRGSNLSVNYLSYGAEVTVNPGLFESFYMFQIPLSGKACVTHRGDQMTADSYAGTVLNHDRIARLHWGAGCRQLLFQIDRNHMETVARTLTATLLPGPIRFDTRVDFSSSSGRALRRKFIACAVSVEESALFNGSLSNSNLMVEYELAQALLVLQPNNISHIIARAEGRIAPRDIRRALEFIHGNLAETITIADIAAAAGVNVRSLQKAFQRAFGETPMQVLRNARLDAAHYQLIARHQPPTVTEAAYSCGFSHLGRFSSHYRNRFGHAPSARPRRLYSNAGYR